jgi:hypothetical protein
VSLHFGRQHKEHQPTNNCILAGNIKNTDRPINPGSGQVGFVVDKVTLGQVFSEYFGFPLPIFISPNSLSS